MLMSSRQILCSASLEEEFPEGSLILGVPAKAVKQVTEEQIKHIQDNADNYVKLSKQYKED